MDSLWTFSILKSNSFYSIQLNCVVAHYYLSSFRLHYWNGRRRLVFRTLCLWMTLGNLLRIALYVCACLFSLVEFCSFRLIEISKRTLLRIDFNRFAASGLVSHWALADAFCAPFTWNANSESVCWWRCPCQRPETAWLTQFMRFTSGHT